MKLVVVSVVFLFNIFFSQVANAGIITNGGFENPDVPNGTWRWFSSDNVDGWQGSNIEIWDSLTRFESYEGEQHAELNAHGSRGTFSIFQTFATGQGNSYDVSFAYAARRSNSEAFMFDILDNSGSVLFSQLMDSHTVSNWSLFNTRFTAISGLSTIRFTTVNSGTYGNFLDDVKVALYSTPAVSSGFVVPNNTNNVSEPSGLMMIMLMLFTFLSFRSFRAK